MVAIVEKYLEQNPGVDVHTLKRVFDLSLVFNHKPIILLPKETPNALKAKAPEKELADRTQIYINNQVQIGDMESIIDLCKNLKYDIEKV